MRQYYFKIVQQILFIINEVDRNYDIVDWQLPLVLLFFKFINQAISESDCYISSQRIGELLLNFIYILRKLNNIIF